MVTFLSLIDHWYRKSSSEFVFRPIRLPGDSSARYIYGFFRDFDIFLTVFIA